MLRAAGTIREARRRAGLTQVELAERLGSSQAAIWRWERGLVEPAWSTVLRAASACGFALDGDFREVDHHEWRLVEFGRDRTPAERLQTLEQYSRFVTKGRRSLHASKPRD